MERKSMSNESTPPFIYQGPVEAACYRDQKIPCFQGNPLTEALPPSAEKEDIFKRMRIRPLYEELHRHYTREERLLLLGHGKRFFEPLSMNFNLASRFDSILRHGYVGRNPLCLGAYREAREKLEQAIQNPLRRDLPLDFNLGLTMIGISGIGKSRALERVSALYPQVIQHSWYQEHRFTWTQLVWLKLDCPPDGSIAGLCTNFFLQIDRILGTNYSQNYGIRNKPPQPAMIAYMNTAAFNHSLGVLIIDEIQNLRRKKDPEMLDFFIQLDNEIGVPIVLVGTPSAEEILSGDLRRARRASGQGEMRWSRMQNDVEWRYFLESLWRYQYVEKKSDLSDELAQTLYYESQGITDLAIRLYFFAQRYAIITNQECIKRETIQMAAGLGLRSVQRFLHDIRNNNIKKIKAHGDRPFSAIEGDFHLSESELMKRIEADRLRVAEASTTNNKQTNNEATQGLHAEAIASQNGAPKTITPTTTQQRAGETLPQIADRGQKALKVSAYEALRQASYTFHAAEHLTEEHVS
ncbi:MAG TPA: ATP-binding protein [Ktedonobacteraceae bacterium]|nr:ATP-binding protein [Ktedonobacteraceae bacterium]